MCLFQTCIYASNYCALSLQRAAALKFLIPDYELSPHPHHNAPQAHTEAE